MHVRCPQCHNPMDLADGRPLGDLTRPSCGSGFSLLGDETLTHDHTRTKTIGHFELLTCEKPFRGNMRTLLHHVIHDDAPGPGFARSVGSAVTRAF